MIQNVRYQFYFDRFTIYVYLHFKQVLGISNWANIVDNNLWEEKIIFIGKIEKVWFHKLDNGADGTTFKCEFYEL